MLFVKTVQTFKIMNFVFKYVEYDTAGCGFVWRVDYFRLKLKIFNLSNTNINKIQYLFTKKNTEKQINKDLYNIYLI